MVMDNILAHILPQNDTLVEQEHTARSCIDFIFYIYLWMVINIRDHTIAAWKVMYWTVEVHHLSLLRIK